MDFENLSSAELAVAKFKCDESLLFFTRFWFRVLRGSKFITNWHHKDICENLELLQNYDLEYLGINIPPRFSKTEIAAVNFIARGLGMNPSGNYLYITASDELRSETSIRIRDIVSHPYFKAMYNVEMKKDQTGKNLWRTNKGGGLKTATIFGQITGFGAGQMIDHTEDEKLGDFIRDFEGSIVLDDLNKMDDSENLNANNTKVMRVLGNTVLSRKNSSDTPIINIQQRAGTEDVTSYFNDLFKDNPKAKTMVYPVISKDGEPLWKWKISVEEINRLKSNPKTSRTFQSQFMQDPRPDTTSLLFPESECKKYKEIPTEIVNENGAQKIIEQGWTFAAIDTADEGADNFSMPIFQVIGNYVYLKDVIFDKDNLTLQLPKVASKLKEHPHIPRVVIELNSFGAFFRRMLEENHPEVEFFGQFAKTNKMSRMLSMSGIVKHYFRFPENPNLATEQFMNQVFKLQKTSKKEDDAPDSLVMAAAHLEAHYNLFKED